MAIWSLAQGFGSLSKWTISHARPPMLDDIET